MLAPSSLRAEDAAVAEDVVGIGGVCGFQGQSLSGAAVADKEGGGPVKGRAGNKEEVVEGEAEAGCSTPGAVAGDAVEDEAPTEKKKRQVALTPYEIEWILAREPCPVSPPADRAALFEVYPPEMVDGVVETRRVVGQAMAFMNRMLRDLQDSVRKDLEETGFVMVDDDVSSRDDEEEEVALES